MKKYLLSLAEQALGAYLSTFIGLVLTNWSGEISMDTITAAAVAAVPAALIVIKSAIARYIGNPESATLT
jgi:hypothetical protein